MITLQSYIQESLSAPDIFKNVDIKKFEWKRWYSDDNYQNECKNIVRKFAVELYSNVSPMDSIETLWKDSVKEYYKTNGWSDNKIEEEYQKDLKIIKRYGWGMYESQSLEQGWWTFMRWVVENK